MCTEYGGKMEETARWGEGERRVTEVVVLLITGKEEGEGLGGAGMIRRNWGGEERD